MRSNRGSTRVPSFAMILLINELIRSATTYGIPTITLVSIISQILIFLQTIPLPSHNVWDMCLSVNAIIDRKEYLRLILSQFCHSDDWHLYYNMVSFLWKGRTLEPRLGIVKFAFTLIVFTISTAFAYLFLNKIIAEITGDYSYLNRCSVGFSGVIFALKVLTTHYDTNSVSSLMGIPIGSKYVVWAELILISLLSPNASFVGHLAGILVGLAHIHGPIKYIIQSLTDIFESIFINNNRNNGYNTSGRSSYSSQHFNNRRNERTYESFIPSGMTEEEQLRRATEESLRNNRSDSHPTAPPYPTQTHSNPPPYPTNDYDAETIRQIRLRRYQT